MANEKDKNSFKRTRRWMLVNFYELVPVASRGTNDDPEFSDSFAFIYREITTEIDEEEFDEPFRAPPIKAA